MLIFIKKTVINNKMCRYSDNFAAAGIVSMDQVTQTQKSYFHFVEISKFIDLI